MRTLTVGASSLEVANTLYSALSEFHPEVISEDGGYQVRVSLVGGDQRISAVLNTIERHVEEQKSAARVELDGRSYTVHPE
jgi:hypothetical protein